MTQIIEDLLTHVPKEKNVRMKAHVPIPVRPLGGCVVLPRPHQLVQRAAEPVLQVTNVKKLHLKANASGNMEIACHASAVRQGPAALPVLQE